MEPCLQSIENGQFTPNVLRGVGEAGSDFVRAGCARFATPASALEERRNREPASPAAAALATRLSLILIHAIVLTRSSHALLCHTPRVIHFSGMETTGCGTAIITPFRADGSLDEAALRTHVNWQIDSGIDFLVACGSTGEAATLDEEEWLTAVHIVVDEAAGRVPVWAGCTHNSTRTLVRLASHLRRIHGLGAVLSANPYYNKPSQEGQFQHFLALAKAVDPLPVTVYNIPGRTGVNLDPETVLRLAEAAPNIQAI